MLTVETRDKKLNITSRRYMDMYMYTYTYSHWALISLLFDNSVE